MLRERRSGVQFHLQTAPVMYALQDANQALAALRDGTFDGAAVLLTGAGA